MSNCTLAVAMACRMASAAKWKYTHHSPQLRANAAATANPGSR